MNPTDRLNALKQLLSEIMNGIQKMIQEGEDLSEDFMNSVANEMNRITDAITKISQETTSQNALTSPEFPQGADLLWLLSGGDVNAFTNYLRTYPGAGLAELSANPPALHRVIQHFQQNNPIAPVAESSDGISNTQLPSSNVSGMKYDPRTHKLLVRFHGENGEPVYQYDGVPENIAQIIYHGNASAKTSGKNRWGEWWPQKNPSLGAAIDQYLKQGGYEYRRVR